MAIFNHQADTPLKRVGLMSDLVICKHENEYGHSFILRQGVIKHNTYTQTQTLEEKKLLNFNAEHKSDESIVFDC